jgi:phosphoribosylanthranilate isomerase
MKTSEPAGALREFIGELGPTPGPSPQGRGEVLAVSVAAPPLPLGEGPGVGPWPKYKVCGLKSLENIAEIARLPIDMMGLIFYEKSPRYAGNLPPEALKPLPASIRKVGVFVNASKETILEKVQPYDLQMVQLHGQETPALCSELRATGIEVIKAFPVAEAADFQLALNYEAACDYFLFDTKTPQYGGSGKQFDWKILSAYTGKTPFFLSGGIGLEDLETIKHLKHPLLYAIDLNSRFETAPGVKDINKLKQLI